MVSIIRKPTIEDVAREAGVSQTTVSFVLSRSEHAARISPETKQRIVEVADRLGYRRNAIGAALQRGYSDTVVLLAVTWELAMSHSDTTIAVTRATADLGLTTIVHVASDNFEASSFLQKVTSLNPYGLLLVWDTSTPPVQLLQELIQRGLPVVSVIPTSVEGVINVTADREQGYYEATRRLIELGHRKIGMILDTSTRWETSYRKEAGYKRALEEAGIEFDQTLLEEETGFGFEAGYEGMTNLLARRLDVTAVLCINDAKALGAIRRIQDIGLSVPEDISVIGYGASVEGQYARPKLTTLAVPSLEVAQKAVSVLTECRRNPERSVEPIYMPMTVIERESTGPAPRR